MYKIYRSAVAPFLFGFSILVIGLAFSFVIAFNFSVGTFYIDFSQPSSLLFLNSPSVQGILLLMVSCFYSAVFCLVVFTRFFGSKSLFGLETERSFYSDKRGLDVQNDVLNEIKFLKEEISSLGQSSGRTNVVHDARQYFSEKDKLEMAEKIVNKSKVALTAKLVELLRKEYVDETASEIQSNALRRLSNQTQTLGSRANLSLLIGIGFASLGLVVLYASFFLTAPKTEIDGIMDFVAEYLPRLSLILIVEIVAFFFLRLYSKALTELRYVQNEMTNVELKLAALAQSMSTGNKETTNEILSVLAATERNNVIEKGQTTVEIEKDRVANEGMTAAFNSAAELLHGRGEQSVWKKTKKST